MKKALRSILTLVCICAVVTAAMAVTNSFTAPIIEENYNKNANQALLEVLPDGGSFEMIDSTSYTLPSTVSVVYRASNGGYVALLETKGYKTGLVIMCGISADGKVVATKVIASEETPNIGGQAINALMNSVVGKGADSISDVDTVAGATMSTAAYLSAIKDALNAVIILGGGSVDIRTEEEIFNDNLAAALPAANGAFEKHFFVEAVEGVDAIYVAKNGKGMVCIIGELFIGVDENGSVISACSAEQAEAATTAAATIKASESADLDLTQFTGLPSQLISAKKTASGNYVLEIKAAGYGINGGDEWHPASGEYIIIRVSMTANGKIIDCLTVSQAETDGLGSACADEKFYGQFDGKTEENYKDIDAISGATMTTDAYKKAIERAFKSVKIFEEGVQG